MNISEELIREIITKVVQEATAEKKTCDCGFEKHVDPSGIIGIKTSTVKCEPFEQDGVALKDVVTLTYDEYDIVLEGTLEIEIDGRIVSGGPGDIIYIPKGSHIHFQTKDKCRYIYTVYPANWAEQ